MYRFRLEITPTGFKLIDHSRNNRRGGGIALLFRGNLNVQKIAANELRSFEYLELIVSSGTFKVRLVILYRPPYSPSHPVTTSTFFADFADYLETLILSAEPFLITGDFNVHVDDSTNPDATRLLDLLDSMGLCQHVTHPTHELGHTIDLIITRQSDSIICGSPVTDHLFSDHLSVLTTLRATKPKIILKERVYRKIKSIDLDSFCSDLAASKVCQDTPGELDELVDCYNRTLTSVLDKHAPFQRKIIPQRRRIPWYNDQILAAKRMRRKAEKKWRLSNSVHDLTAYKSARNFATNLMKKARFDFYQNLIQENSSDQGKLFRVSKQLLNQNCEVPLPPHFSKTMLANEMANFFVEKISNIRSKFKECTTEDCQDCSPIMDPQCPSFSSFQAITEEEAHSIIMNLAKKSSALDPIPTPLLVKCIDVLLPVITKMINISLDSGYFPSAWREALVLPTLKKAGLDTVFKNYRPVSNLSFISKVTEKAVFIQIDNHMKKHDLYPSLQSAYRKNHSTETALLKVTNDVLMKMNSQHAVLLVLLDLSAAFDTVDHSLLLRRLQTSFGISGAPLDWFTSYLMARRQRVSIPGVLSDSCSVDWGVPQGSCLGPLLYIIYSSKLFHVIERHLPNSHCYADDSQLYLSFRPDVLSSQQDATFAMQNCIKDIRLWMEHDKLLLNDEKTEFLIIGTRQQLTKVNISSITVGDSDVMRSSVVKNLGVFIDDKLSMNSHVNKICNTSFYYLHNIMRIRKHLSRKSTETLIHAFVSSRLDYCNSLLYGLPHVQIEKLQRVQNAAARLIFKEPKFSHITPVLYQLHWLPIKYRIEFKILLFTFKAIHGMAPDYICKLISRKSSTRYLLRSSERIMLETPSGKILSTLGGRAFCYAAPKLWNNLPCKISSLDSLSSFKCQLKTHLFKQAFNL